MAFKGYVIICDSWGRKERPLGRALPVRPEMRWGDREQWSEIRGPEDTDSTNKEM